MNSVFRFFKLAIFAYFIRNLFGHFAVVEKTNWIRTGGEFLKSFAETRIFEDFAFFVEISSDVIDEKVS